MVNSRYARIVLAAAGLLALLALPAPGFAQVEPCRVLMPEVRQPPANLATIVRCVQIKVHPTDDTVIPLETFQARIQMPLTFPSKDVWAPYNETTVQADFWNLWRTNFLENLWIEVIDEPYDNGVPAKHIIFHLEERSRVKVVDYVSADEDQKLKVEISKIDEKLKEENVEIRLDSFVDETTIRKVKGLIRDLHSEKGYNDAVIETEMSEVEGGPKLVKVTFKIDHGPKVQLREVLFDGNTAVSDRVLRGQMKENKPKNWLSFITDSGTYHEAKYGEDADRVSEYYKNNGYAGVQVGLPKIEFIEDSKDGETRWIRLRVPVDEGQKYTVGKFEIAGDSTIKPEAIRALFKVQPGDQYSLKKIRKGIEKAREIYGRFGFWQWQPDPELLPRGIDPATGKPAGPEAPPPIMDVTIKMVEGKQFLVNRITFGGNTTTHDSVIRREMRVWEGGVFDTEALKDSVKRLNQLGYFKTFEGKEGEMDVVPTPGTENQVDINLKFEEQNRNQLAFGAGVSQFDGFFGQLSFQTANFLGRGETVGVSLQRGSQAKQYQVSFSEPYLFDRPITVGMDVYTRQYIFPIQYTQESTGSNTVVGLPLADFTRLFLSYSYERVKVFDINPSYLLPSVLEASPYLKDTLLIEKNGRRIVSKISPSVAFNTINAPIFPSNGSRYTLGMDVAGVGGNTQYLQARGEGIWYVPLTARTALGLRAQAEFIRPYGNTTNLPIFEKLFLGGEYNIRGFDLRTVGPRDPATGVLTGGNKTLVLNAEYYVTLFGQVRVLGFFDAGQVRDIGQRFGWKEDIFTTKYPELGVLTDYYDTNPYVLTPPGSISKVVTSRTSAFKTSAGGEVRFFMPVLNVPFRLIAAYNPQRFGVLNNNLVQTPRFTFRFAVGTTF
jgi:outer membrane protein insertion porin family